MISAMISREITAEAIVELRLCAASRAFASRLSSARKLMEFRFLEVNENQVDIGLPTNK